MNDAVLEPGLVIVDPHHHLWHPHTERYYTDVFQADILASGHNVTTTVYVEAGVMNRQRGPEHLRCVGEAEFAAGMAAMGESGMFGPTRIGAGFVGAADITLGDRLDEVLDALHVASGGRLRGLRGTAVWDADPSVNSGTRPYAPRGLMEDSRFRAGVACLARRGLVYDAWQYYPQLGQLGALADAVPDAVIVVNHCGGLVGVGAHAAAGNFERWRERVREAAQRPNVRMKLGGLAGRRTGFGYDSLGRTATLEELVADWRPYIETCIEFFGADRCMFESNYPVDRVAGDYRMLWNVFKAIAAKYSESEKAALFQLTAARTYSV